MCKLVFQTRTNVGKEHTLPLVIYFLGTPLHAAPKKTTTKRVKILILQTLETVNLQHKWVGFTFRQDFRDTQLYYNYKYKSVKK